MRRLQDRGLRLLPLVAVIVVVGSQLAFRLLLTTDRDYGGTSVWLRDPDNPCGSVAVALAGHWVGQPHSLAAVNRTTAADGFGRTTMLDLLAGLRSIGLAGEAVRLPLSADVNIRLPIIVHMRKSHWAVLVRNDRNVCVLLDPPHDPVEAAESRLLQEWDGAAILVAEDGKSLLAGLQALGITEVEEQSK